LLKQRNEKQAFFIFLDKKNLSIMSSAVDSDTPVAEKTGIGSAKTGKTTSVIVMDQKANFI
jgi:hypothetical protein